jgi:osomolarity two-component system sensor histidine kinase NIK1
MAAVLPAGSASPGLAPDSSPFEQYLLALLSVISQAPSPSYPFPTSDTPAPATGDIKLQPFTGEKTDAQQAIEAAVIALGSRLKETERVPSPAKVNAPATSLLTPEWTPPPVDAELVSGSPECCPSCARPIFDQNTPTPHASGQSGDFGSVPLRSSMSTPSRSNMPNTPAGWSTNAADRAGGMSAEKELELLRAQVQDIARVCKVSF